MSWIIKGTCNQCGKCCKPPVMVENPCISKGEDRCKFYVNELNDKKFGHCLILGRGNKPIKNVRDRDGNKITQKQIKWFNDNCPNYPKLLELVKGLKLPPGCDFSIEKVD